MNDITSTLAAPIKRQAEADKRLYADKSRSAADHQYFMGAHDAVDKMLAKLTEGAADAAREARKEKP